MAIITLEEYEAHMAATVGMRRQLSSTMKGMQQRVNMPGGYSGNNWTEHIEGAAAECAVAKYLEVYWSGSVDTFVRDGDVMGMEVRASIREDRRLKVAENDPDDRIVIGVHGRMPVFEITGWILARNAKALRQYRDDPGYVGRPAFFIPVSELNSPESLRVLMDRVRSARLKKTMAATCCD